MPAAAAGDAAETTAIPVQRPKGGEPPKKPKAPPAAKPDPESTEKLPKQQKTSGERPDDDRRRGRGLSAQDLLRREGRL
jgi:hypothetical protein